MTCVLVTSMRVMSVEARVSTVETQFGGAVCARPCMGCTCTHLVLLDLIIVQVTVLINGVQSRIIGCVTPELLGSGVNI